MRGAINLYRPHFFEPPPYEIDSVSSPGSWGFSTRWLSGLSQADIRARINRLFFSIGDELHHARLSLCCAVLYADILDQANLYVE